MKMRYRNSGRKFESKFKPVWIISVLIVTVFVVLISVTKKQQLKGDFIAFLECFDKSEKAVLPIMRQNADFIGNAVWTFFTILASFTVFYYSSLGYRNYGVSNRKIIGYTYGAGFLPFLIVVNGVVVCVMTIAFYLEEYVTFYLNACYSFILQAFLIALSIIVTSQAWSYRVLIKIECEQYSLLCDAVSNSETNLQIYRRKEESNKNRIIYHIDNILKGEENLAEKLEIIQELFWVPFSGQCKKQNCNDFTIYHGTYYFFYYNLQFLADYLESNPQEDQRIYSMFYESIVSILQELDNTELYGEEKKYMYNKFLIYVSAIFHAFIPGAYEQKYSFFEYIINVLIEDKKLKQEILVLYLESLLFLWLKNQFDYKKNIIKEEEFIRSCPCDFGPNIENVKKSLIPILESWMMDSTNTVNKWEDIRKITENTRMYGNVDFISYLCGLIWK